MQQFPKIKSVCNKLEAQFNFQTMTANWYENEDCIFFVKLSLATKAYFESQQKEIPLNEITKYSDDVISYNGNNESEQTLICFILITDTEHALLNTQSKLLAGLLHIKLQKVLNLIGNSLALDPI